MTRCAPVLIFPILCLLVLLPFAAQAETGEIGTALEVRNLVGATLGDEDRALRKGDGVRPNEVVKTEADSSGQFVFLDKTRLAVAPNSEIVLDRFVYNPDPNAREIVLTSLRGSFRFVSGDSSSESYRIVTPVATLGVRGTMFDVHVDENGTTVVALLAGAVRVCHRGGRCRDHNRPGRFLRIAADGVFRIGRNANWVLGGIAMATAFPFIASGKGLGEGFAVPAVVPKTMLGGGTAAGNVIAKPAQSLKKPFKARKRKRTRRKKRKRRKTFLGLPL